MDLEDFSFPSATESLPCLIDSPPLWRASSPPSFSRHHEHEEWRSASVDEEPAIGAGAGAVPVPGKKGGGSLSMDEEKMDMLWEDFNEELLSSSPLKIRRRGKSEKDMSGRFGCVKSLSISKANADRPGVVALLKVLRKLFLIHSSNQNHQTLKKGQRQGQPPPHCW
ncbi:uncharacterized protein LOC116199353 [Punica granatum]|uniref:Uncharacterized protein n=2 Tax=Punica granatum TaxID=22663 RepID=A0A218VYR9_PUNGR|nr:uncharacterized protein LOC116199353 [Punica granatum]OWM65737.1 hypothetical protein CDL15_Pgr015161 [Punica granatum]PKI62418.1 hypothetical protein CRG98_017224 [Punica granatum]